jgi:cytoskeleton-associated protein 5
LRRVAGPSAHNISATPVIAPTQASRLAIGIPRPMSPATRVSTLPRAGSPTSGLRTLGHVRSSSPAPSKLARPASPIRAVRTVSPTRTTQEQPVQIPPTSPQRSTRPKSMLPSRLARPRSNLAQPAAQIPPLPEDAQPPSSPVRAKVNGHQPAPSVESMSALETLPDSNPPAGSDDITIVISSILSSDPSRSVDALKKIQKILAIGPDAGLTSPAYQELAEHTEGLIETITLQMAHVFDQSEDLVVEENFRLAKHLIQTLNNFCDHPYLAESLTVDITTSLLEELTLRLLETDDSETKKVKDLSRFINMIILRLFATGRRMSIFR